MALQDPLVNLGITPPFQRNENADWSVPSVYSVSPFICLETRNAKLCSSSHMNQSKPPSGNVCWSFQVPFQTQEQEGEGKIKSEQLQEARDSDRETTLRETERDRSCSILIEDTACLFWHSCCHRTLCTITVPL